MLIPTIHLNGTSKEALLTSLCDAIDAVHVASHKLAAACPNSRDYYPQGSDAIGSALSEHDARMDKLKSVVFELEQIALAIDSRSLKP